MEIFKPKSPWEKAKKSFEKGTKRTVKQTKEITKKITNALPIKRSKQSGILNIFDKPKKTQVQRLAEKVESSEVFNLFIEKGVVILTSSNLLAQTNGAKALSMRDTISKKLVKDNIYLEAALISDDVYDSDSVDLQGGWKRSSEFGDIMKNSVQKDINGLVSHLYSRVRNGKKEYIYAAGGTDVKNTQDVLTDIFQLLFKVPQYEESLKIAKALKERIGRKGSLMFAGHSLGGGIATNNALHTGLKAIVFNPAGLSNATLEDLYGKTDEKKIECIVLHNDILNLVQDTCQCIPGLNMIPSSIGQKMILHSSKGMVDSHSISTVIETIEEYMEA